MRHLVRFLFLTVTVAAFWVAFAMTPWLLLLALLGVLIFVTRVTTT